MTERKTHEWYLDGSKDKYYCRHCGACTTSKNVEEVNKQKCIWPNPLIQDKNEEVTTSIEINIRVTIPEQIKPEDIEEYVTNKVVFECYQLPENKVGVMGFRELDIEVVGINKDLG